MADINITINPHEFLDEIEECELIDYIENLGYAVADYAEDFINRNEVELLMGKLNTSKFEEREIYEKLLRLKV